MPRANIYEMKLSKVYPLLVNKAVRKNRTKEEVDEVTCWLTGYTKKQLEELVNSDINYQQFFDGAPQIHPNAIKITGSICGVKIAEIEDPLMKKIRYLDKLVDELAKGKAMDKILRQ